MLRDAAVELMGYRLGQRDDLNDRIIAEMQFVQEMILEGTGAFTPWFLETEMSFVEFVAGEERVPVPDDFIGEIEGQHLWLYTADNTDRQYVELHKSSYDILIQRYPARATPRQYAISGSYFLLAPAPSEAGTLRMRYYAKDFPVTSNIENQWLRHASDLFMAETCAIMADDYLQNPAMAEKFRQKAIVARDRLYKKHELRQHVNRVYGMGED
jgi:hypothetical protein